MKILAIPGSLRENSSSNAILRVVVAMAPESVSIETYKGLGILPHFNDSEEVPDAVANFRAKVKAADAILICTPEYAFGVPGSLKNALDWTVGSGDFIGKPVGLITASSQGERGHAALLLILQAIAARVIENASMLISFVRAKLDDAGNVKDQSVKQALQQALHALIDATDGSNSDQSV